MSSKVTFREKAECFLQEAWVHLGLRLPTEGTLAMITALCFMLTNADAAGASRWQLNTAYQTVKSSWKSLFKRLNKVPDPGPTPFLLVLPSTFDQLPQELQLRFEADRPVPVHDRPVQEQSLLLLTARVPLRSSSDAALQLKDKSSPNEMFSRALLGFVNSMQAQQHGGLGSDELPGLKILRPPPASASHAQQQQSANQAPQSAAAGSASPAAVLPQQPLQLQLQDLPREQPAPEQMPSADLQASEQAGASGTAASLPTASAVGMAELLGSMRKEEKDGSGKSEPVKQRPAACPKALKRPRAAPSQVREDKKPSLVYQNETAHCKSWGLCKIEYYTHKSYIRYWDGGKLKMVIGASAGDHKKICQTLWPHVKRGAAKDALYDLRAKLLEKHS